MSTSGPWHSTGVDAPHGNPVPASSGVQILRTLSEFESLSAEWKALWFEDAHATPFQRPEWLLPWWHHFSQQDLCVVCLRTNGRLTGMIPAYVYVEPERGERQLLLVGAGTSDYLDGVFAPCCGVREVREALSLLAEEDCWKKCPWDVAYFTQLRPVSPLYQALEGSGATRFAGESCSACPASSIAELPKKIRADVRYFHNAAIGQGKLALHVADETSAMKAFGDLVQLHSASWRERDQPGVLADADVLAWHREAIPQLQAAGCLRLYTLMLDAEPVAALYALIDPVREQTDAEAEAAGRTAYFYLIGYAPEHAAFKPGTLLTAMASEHAAAEGVQVLDMLRGEESYKRFWKVREVPTFGFAIRREHLLPR